MPSGRRTRLGNPCAAPPRRPRCRSCRSRARRACDSARRRSRRDLALDQERVGRADLVAAGREAAADQHDYRRLDPGQLLGSTTCGRGSGILPGDVEEVDRIERLLGARRGRAGEAGPAGARDPASPRTWDRRSCGLQCLADGVERGSDPGGRGHGEHGAANVLQAVAGRDVENALTPRDEAAGEGGLEAGQRGDARRLREDARSRAPAAGSTTGSPRPPP